MRRFSGSYRFALIFLRTILYDSFKHYQRNDVRLGCLNFPHPSSTAGILRVLLSFARSHSSLSFFSASSSDSRFISHLKVMTNSTECEILDSHFCLHPDEPIGRLKLQLLVDCCYALIDKSKATRPKRARIRRMSQKWEYILFFFGNRKLNELSLFFFVFIAKTRCNRQLHGLRTHVGVTLIAKVQWKMHERRD